MNDLSRLIRFIESRRFVAARTLRTHISQRSAAELDALLHRLRGHLNNLSESLGHGPVGHMQPLMG